MSWVETIMAHPRKLSDVAEWSGERWQPRADAPADVTHAYLAAIHHSAMVRAFREEAGISWGEIPLPTIPWLLGSQLSVLFANPPVDRGTVERILYEVYGLNTDAILDLARRGR